MGELTAGSIALAAARWLNYGASLLIVGLVGARFVCARTLGRDTSPMRDLIERRHTAAARWSVIALAVSSVVLLLAQDFNWYGASGFTDRENIALIFTTGWGSLWTKFAVTSAAVLTTFLLAWRWRALRGVTAFVLAVSVALATPLPGHGGSHGTYNWWYHAAHIFGGGLWLGTLAVLLLTTRPIWLEGGELLKRLLKNVTPVALTGAAIVIGTGALLAWNHVMTLEYLTDSEFGRSLMVKVGAVAVTASLGFLNWRRLGPRASDEMGRRRLRRVAIVEAVLALVVILALTAWMSGQQTPDTLDIG